MKTPVLSQVKGIQATVVMTITQGPVESDTFTHSSPSMLRTQWDTNWTCADANQRQTGSLLEWDVPGEQVFEKSSPVIKCIRGLPG